MLPATRFLVCIHDATPAYAREIRSMLDDLAPLLGRRLSVAVVPDWHGKWPLRSHPEFCALLRDRAEERLLHGYAHRRGSGWGPVAWLAERSDEMNGLDRAATHQAIERGQHILADVFGEPARGFLAPAWQAGRFRIADALPMRIDHVLGFFSIEASGGRRIPVATWTWDCGRWSWLGHVGHGLGRLMQSIGRGVPSLAIHPRDLHRGYWPSILRLTTSLLAAGCEPVTPARLLEERC